MKEYKIGNSELLNVHINELFVDIEQKFAQNCGLNKIQKDIADEHRQVAEKVYDKYIRGKSVNVLLKKFSKECVDSNGFVFSEDNRIKCQVFEKLHIAENNVISGYLYTFHASLIDENYISGFSLLEQFYIENWLIAVMDAVREWLQRFLADRERKKQAEVYVTDSFGPGFYGVPIQETETMVNLLDGKRAGVTIDKNKVMHPSKSIVGIYLVLNKDIGRQMIDCISCIGNEFGCQYCKNGKKL